MTINNIIESSRVRAALVGKTKKGKNIKSFGIMSPENPMGNKASPEENGKSRTRLKKQLKDGRNNYTKIQGMYDKIEEKSFFIYNINLNSLKGLNKTYDQQSFVFGENGKDGMVFHFYKKSAGASSQYVKKYSKTKVRNQKDADDFFSRNKTYKFQIPFFETFEEAGKELNERFDYIDDDSLTTSEVEYITNHFIDKKWITANEAKDAPVATMKYPVGTLIVVKGYGGDIEPGKDAWNGVIGEIRDINRDGTYSIRVTDVKKSKVLFTKKWAGREAEALKQMMNLDDKFFITIKALETEIDSEILKGR